MMGTKSLHSFKFGLTQINDFSCWQITWLSYCFCYVCSSLLFYCRLSLPELHIFNSFAILQITFLLFMLHSVWATLPSGILHIRCNLLFSRGLAIFYFHCSILLCLTHTHTFVSSCKKSFVQYVILITLAQKLVIFVIWRTNHFWTWLSF